MSFADKQTGGGFGMTVMQVLPALETGGVERGAIDTAEAVVATGGRAIVVSSGGALVRELDRMGAEHVELPVHRKGMFAIMRNARRLEDLIIHYGVDVVHARSRAPAWAARRAARRTDTPFVTTFHGTYNYASFLKKRYNAIMTAGDRVIAISHFIARHMQETYGVDPAKVRVIHRGIDLEIFDPAKVPGRRVMQLAQNWRMPDGTPVVMLPGRLTRWKGHASFLEAVARLKTRDFLAVIVGSDQGRGGYRSELERMVTKLGLQSSVRFVDHCNDMAAAFLLADVVVSASTDPEAFGRVIVEAQAMGRPVIASDHGGAQETVISGQTGWLVAPEDAAALARAIDTALGLDEAQRAQVAEAAMTNARDRFSKERMTGLILSVYREAVAARRARRA